MENDNDAHLREEQHVIQRSRVSLYKQAWSWGNKMLEFITLTRTTQKEWQDVPHIRRCLQIRCWIQ